MDANIITLANKLKRVSLLVFAFISFGAQAVNSTPASARENSITPFSYRSVPQVVPELSQLVYYYSPDNKHGPLNIYIDKAFHTSLLPGEFTLLCVAPGEHSFAAALDDAPRYAKKTRPDTKALFKSGQTYFVRAAVADGSVSNQPVARISAERALAAIQRQHRIVNRASAVKPCQYTGGEGVTLVREAILFRFAGSRYQDLLPASRDRLNDIITALKKVSHINAINLTGYTDGIGRIDSNRRLSQARAETVRLALLRAGFTDALIHAAGNGVAQSADGCRASVSHQDDGCNRLSRRVDVVIDGR